MKEEVLTLIVFNRLQVCVAMFSCFPEAVETIFKLLNVHTTSQLCNFCK